ncbi:hypothetical protein H6S82_13565 [Planktothrix sp. FACHB-1355]|uniref:Uncharacterized protein n=1 Tax=Aerosakkonema funiforme FACHB-1375 TaxID=2949571 RepID=A0A926ZLS9_9CYAN|nr:MULTISPECIES: hypothetical protein [Oscillatoriales]MBD2185376.1 hypothetical protein [Aerosakkonema funiforme FACHB-1375]MBD3559882.1 hypothetical protein [Planktothrix sp. FACHB-1355]
MAANPSIMQAVEQLHYRVTVGDVAAKAGFDLNVAQQGLLALASDAGGHLQVAETGEIVYQFPENFRAILRNKFLRLRLQEWWQKTWKILFYLIRISFGLVLLTSIVLIFVAIAIILITVNSSRDSDDSRSSDSGGGTIFIPYYWFGPDWFWVFYPDYDSPQYQYRRREKPQMNFLEAVFSFLFGDGNPNANLEARRWQEIATAIRNNGGAVVAEQIAPYLDNIGAGYSQEYEDYMLPVLARFNGLPEVSPEGQIVYRFPDLQVTAAQQHPQVVPTYLQELPWRFSAASSGQIILSAGLGAFNLVGALVLGNLLAGGTIAAKLGGLVALVQSIYWLLLGYGIAFLAVPFIRYFWIQWRNGKIAFRNQQRQARVMQLNQPSANLQQKIAYARQFAAETIIDRQDLAYTTETDLLEQDIERKDQIDTEWQRRLNN